MSEWMCVCVRAFGVRFKWSEASKQASMKESSEQTKQKQRKKKNAHVFWACD